ncbi:hypothetical protein [Streptomyces wedmorensis]
MKGSNFPPRSRKSAANFFLLCGTRNTVSSILALASGVGERARIEL